MSTQYGEDVAVLKDQMKDVKAILERIEAKQDVSAATYATKGELKTFKIITVPIIIIVTAVITGLVYYYLSHGHTLTTPDIQNNTVSTSPASSPSGSSSTTNTTNNTTSPSSSTNPTPASTGGVNLTIPKVQEVN